MADYILKQETGEARKALIENLKNNECQNLHTYDYDPNHLANLYSQEVSKKN